MNKCNHEFIIFKSKSDHARIVCAYCGHVRDVYRNGEVHILKENGEIKNKTTNTI